MPILLNLNNDNRPEDIIEGDSLSKHPIRYAQCKHDADTLAKEGFVQGHERQYFLPQNRIKPQCSYDTTEIQDIRYRQEGMLRSQL